MSVTAKLEPLVIPTYPVGAPEKNPVFFDKRVYQGSSGKVYPVPFIDKVYDDPQDVTYQSARLENEFVRLVMLPEIGGRIYLGQDKKNKNYDFFYRNDVIKPALVGLAGPWISGGVEFNWPQHHRPGTFMPADVFIEKEDDGARTIWMSEHDPLNRLKGMHGIRLRPGSSLIELRARLYNRTPLTQTFLWWANVAALVHDQYQSFFPPDVHYVADHAVRAMSSFPIANNPYYGVDYQNRPGHNDLGWYKNIPVPTSYMVCETHFDFFGGYDFKAGGGFVHIANRHVAPGKKQWTWGDHAFGHAWDRELTDTNGPYIELMAGVYTDNQPDFTYLAPYETKTFSQFWWPIQGIGPVQQATDLAALRMVVRPEDRTLELGLCVSEKITNATLRITDGTKLLLEEKITLAPGQSWKNESLKFTGENPAALSAILLDEEGDRLLAYRPVDPGKLTRTREQATEPPSPADIASNDELYLTGEHLELYRHPTRSPEAYWNEALQRDPGDARSHIALGRRKLKQGHFAQAETHFRAAIARLTHRHPNPETGEAHYFLGITLTFQDRHDEAYPAFYKATWNYAWRGAAYYHLACIDCRRLDFDTANRHLDESLATLADHNKAYVLQALIAQKSDDPETAAEILEDLQAADPLDHYAAVAAVFNRQAKIQIPPATRNDAQTILDIAFDLIDAGFNDDALALLDAHHKSPVETCAVPNPLARTPMTHYLRAWLTRDPRDLEKARAQSPDYFFPSRLHEQIVLEWAVAGASGSCKVEGASGSFQNVEGASGSFPKSNQEPEAPATAPPTFTPTFLTPSKPLDRYKINLPHWRQTGGTYAITFRLADSLPKSVTDQYLREKQRLTSMLEKAIEECDESLSRDCDARLRELYSDYIETALDAGHGECHLKNPEIAKIVADTITHFDGDRYQLAAWCLMPNHVHLIIKPLGDNQLADIIRGMKTYSARNANKQLGRSGPFWQEEYYDHLVRDMEDFRNQVDYIKRNPAKLANWPWIKVEGASGSLRKVEGASGSFPKSNQEPKAPATTQQEPEAPATFALGNYYYNLNRHADAIRVWQAAVDAGTTHATTHRNLAIAVWNARRDGEAARAFYQKAIALDPADPRLVSEYDQLRAKLNDTLTERLAFLESTIDRVLQRDDCTIALAGLYNGTGNPAKALEIVTSRRFHPWEGGEGAVLRQFTQAHLRLGRAALESGDAATALKHFTGAMDAPPSLGEAYHLLQAKADVNYWIGRALKALGRNEEAETHFLASANEAGDFSEMAVTAHSPLSYYRGLSLRELNREADARAVFTDLAAFARQKLTETARIDYFATSLPNLLVFDEDLQARRDAENHLLLALAHHGLGDTGAAKAALEKSLAFTNTDPHAADLASVL